MDATEKFICLKCVGETFLSDEIRREGTRRPCSYCGATLKSIALEVLSSRIDTAFQEHYVRTPCDPSDFECMMLADRESSYEWERKGEPVLFAIMEAAELPEAAAADVQSLLEEQFADWDSQVGGEETEYESESQYELRGVDDSEWMSRWRRFDGALRSEARFFSADAIDYLNSVFLGIEALRDQSGVSLITEIGPGCEIASLFRARVFQDEGKLLEALGRPDLHIGPPPSALAISGRMNARGISVFYGANDTDVAVAEVRPPVGSKVAVAQFVVQRSLLLLDLTKLARVVETGSLFDPEHSKRLARASFLRKLSTIITEPVMPDDEALDYLPTQAVADFLATSHGANLDGIIYPSIQLGGNALNVCLFHKAADVEQLLVVEGTTFETASEQHYDEGPEVEYSVRVILPPADADQKPERPLRRRTILEPAAAATLRILADAIYVHHTNSVIYRSSVHGVWRRERQTVKGTSSDF